MQVNAAGPEAQLGDNVFIILVQYSNILIPSLLSIKNRKLDNPLIIKILKHTKLHEQHQKVIFYWFPNYIGIQGAHITDSIVKSALGIVPNKNFKISCANLKSVKYCQQLWNKNTPKKKNKS